MSLFGKGGDLVDYTYLQKRGLIKKSPENKQSNVSRTKDGFVDFSSMNSTNKIEKEENTQSPLNNLFENTSNTSENPPSASTEPQNSGFVSLFDSPSFSNQSQTNSSETINNSDLNAVKIKLEDLEYKLSNLLDKLSIVESKLSNFEKKVFD